MINGDSIVTVQFENGMTMKTYVENIPTIREIYHWNVYTQAVTVEKGDVVVDAGAFYGAFALKAAIDGASTVIAFEPHKGNFKLLRENIEANKHLFETNFILCDTALANTKSEVKLFERAGHGSNSLVMVQSKDRFSYVPTERLDDVLEQLSLRIDFLKMDVEGAAGIILEGAEKVLQQPKLKIAAAVYHVINERDAVRQQLEKYGFRYEKYNQVGWNRPNGEAFYQAWKGGEE